MERVVVVKRLNDRDEPWRYWLTRPMAERVAMVEELRPRTLRIFRRTTSTGDHRSSHNGHGPGLAGVGPDDRDQRALWRRVMATDRGFGLAG